MDTLYLVTNDELKNEISILNIENGKLSLVSTQDLIHKLTHNEMYVENCICNSNQKLETTMGELSDYRKDKKCEKLLLIEQITNTDGKVIKYKYCTSSGKVFTESVERVKKLVFNYFVINALYDEKETFKIRGNELKSSMEYSITDYCTILIKRLELLAEEVDRKSILSNAVIKYSVIRNVVLKAASKGFQSMDKSYNYSQGIYKHRDCSTTLIDLDGFYVDREKEIYTTDVGECLIEISNHVKKYMEGKTLPLLGITDSDERIKQLATCSFDTFINSNLIPVSVICKSDKKELINSNLCVDMLLKPIYKDEVELSYVLNKIYRDVYNKAKQCTVTN